MSGPMSSVWMEWFMAILMVVMLSMAVFMAGFLGYRLITDDAAYNELKRLRKRVAELEGRVSK